MNLPSDFSQRTHELLGDNDYRQLEDALQDEAPVSIRVNSAKCDKEVKGERVPWSANGIYLAERPTFTFDPLFHAGCYYVQEASSMFVEQVLKTYVSSPVVMLDLCAAPGGKSTAARAVLPDGSLLVANEVMRNRVQILAENLIKWGNTEVVVTNNDPSDFAALLGMFDVVLTDVPCSGEGMFRKDAVAVEEWSADNVQICRQRQRRILADVWTALKPGGLLIYSTCTYNREEDEDNVAWIARELGAEVLEVPVRPEWNITGNLTEADFPVYRFLPHKTKGEGFFLAVLRKDTEGGEEERTGDYLKEHAGGRKDKKKGGREKQQVMTVPKEVKDWLQHPEDYQFEVKGTGIVAFPKKHSETYALLQQVLKVIHAGVTLGELKGKDIVPDHSLAMTIAMRQGKFLQAELSYEQAIGYLRKEAVVLDSSVPRGYILLTYKKIPLGFAKNIGNRANNLYPQEWRIRSGYLPDVLSMVWDD